MTPERSLARIPTGVPNLDVLLGGGLVKDSMTLISGPPGSGKTVLAQQIAFHHASRGGRALYVSTLSEPSAKLLRYLAPFGFFDPRRLDRDVHFVDLGSELGARGVNEAARQLMEHVKRVKPGIVVIDSFKVFDDFAESAEALRRFTYALAVDLMAWEATILLLGEYEPHEVQANPVFSIIDGQIRVGQQTRFDEELRILQVVKMRGTAHSRDEHPFAITDAGIIVSAPRVTITRRDREGAAELLKTGISKLDDLLGAGIPRGSSLLVSGVAGTGKTSLLLDFIIRGALRGQPGILFSFEETDERLRAAARAFGWDVDAAIAAGLVEIVFFPQPDIQVEAGMLMMEARIAALGAMRVAIDSVSVFLHKLREPQLIREKVFQLASILQNADAVGFFATDIAYGSSDISRFGVEETVVDGIILLTSTSEGLERQRYLEIYKLRRASHLKGRHSIVIGANGVEVFPRYSEEVAPCHPPVPLGDERLTSGVPGLDALLGGGLYQRSVTLATGGLGTGKTTMGLHFLVAGAAAGEPGTYVSLEHGPAQIARSAASLGLAWPQGGESGAIHARYLSPEAVRSSQFFSLLRDQIMAQGTRRLVLDGAAYLASAHMPADEVRELLLVLVSQFKRLDVTTLVLLESTSLLEAGTGPDPSFASIADNLVMLRYDAAGGELTPCLTVVKAQDSAHDRGAYAYTIDGRGMRLGGRIRPAPGAAGPGKDA